MKVLVTGDWHVRDDQPGSRTDNFFETMVRKIKWILDTAVEQGCSYVLQPGDFFDKSRPVQSQVLEILLNRTIAPYLSDLMILSVPGNHDLPYHRMDQLDRSSLGVMFEYGTVVRAVCTTFPVEKIVVHGAGWGEELPDHDLFPADFRIGMTHVSIDETNTFPEWEKASDYLARHPAYDLIVTGDNHKQFVVDLFVAEENRNQILINAGALFRTSVDEIDHKPAVYIVDTDLPGKYKRIEIPVERDVLRVEEYLERKERDEAIQAFVESMRSEDHGVGLSFEDNLRDYMASNNVPKSIVDIVWEAYET